jgi:DNA-directed RNA polymerase subunit omega
MSKGCTVTSERPTLVDPPVEQLLEAAENSKFTLVAVASMRAREINEYWNGLGKGNGSIVPPQVNSNSNKSLTMALEELAAGKLEVRRPTQEELDKEAADKAEADANAAFLDPFAESGESADFSL